MQIQRYLKLITVHLKSIVLKFLKITRINGFTQYLKIIIIFFNLFILITCFYVN